MQKSTLGKERISLGRRSALKGLVGIGVGSLVGYTALPPVATGLNQVVSDVTGRPTGNAAGRQRIEDACFDEPQTEVCISEYKYSVADRLRACIVGPTWEELFFRALPSGALDFATERRDSNVSATVSQVVVGESRFNGPEIATGVASSVVFGALHNITKKGVDTRTIPASQTMVGLVFWGLMRKFGVASSIAAHSALNFKATSR